ncbi:MAG TPA: DinB family protein [Planctomycetaceae bacterium]|nr:DinB family protein [Planctomycetaceae bacterium]
MALLSRHALDGTPWYGKALCRLLKGVTAGQAAAHPIRGAHNIWEEVLHAITWRQVAIKLLQGEKAPRVPAAKNWPKPPKPTAAAWKQTLDELKGTQPVLEAAIDALTDKRLSEKAREKRFSFYILIHGVIQHDAYHAGQIALLKNALK